MFNTFHSRLSIVLIALSIPIVAMSQQNDSTFNQTLNEQFRILIQDSETYNEYKVIKQDKLNAFNNVIGDSVDAFTKSREEANAKIRTQKATIESLNEIISEKDETISSGEEEKSNLSVLGVQFDKQTYAIISLIMPFLLIVVIVSLLVKMKNNITDTKEAKKSLISVEKEFDEYKKRALDTQMKLKRELQTERNKLLEYNK